MSNAGDSVAVTGGGGARAPRLPRWTRQEILVLIQGKKVVEGRGRPRTAAGRAALAGAAPVEPKWAAVAAYCRRHGVDRGAVQCRKRWSNLAGDYKKIKEWEGRGGESFWVMRNDVRREQRLPGFFDKEVYDILDGAAVVEGTAIAAVPETVFDGVFSDEGKEEEEEDDDEERTPPLLEPAPVVAAPATAVVAVPAVVAAPVTVTAVEVAPVTVTAAAFSGAVLALGADKKSEQTPREPSEHPGTVKYKHPASDSPSPAKELPSEKGSPSWESNKRRRTLSEDESREPSLQSQLIEVLDRNNKVLASHLEAQNVNYQLDREQRKEQADGLLGVLGKLADALGRIADKL